MTVLQAPLLCDLGYPHGFVAAGTRAERVPVMPQQVHGVRVVHPRALAANAQADGLWTRDRAVGVRTADCVPVLLGVRGERLAAAIHAGWRGVAQGIVERFLARAGRRWSLTPRRWVVALGPAAGGCCYEVGPEVAAALGLPPRRGRIDLRELLRRRLVALGCTIELVGPCTICTSTWASYRRQGAAAGRNVAWIAVAP